MSHGHVKPNLDGSKADCGGPAECATCKAEQEAALANLKAAEKLIADKSAARLEYIMNRLSEVVTTYGPQPLSRGMSNVEAHEAILACVEDLALKLKVHDVRKADLAALMAEKL